MASISHRRNAIGSLVIFYGTIVTNHDQNVGILWESYRNRMGVSKFSGISYDLSSLLQFHQLDHLADDFSEDELNNVIIPLDHAPRPDGFNGKFIRKCWPILKADFMRLFADFFNNAIDISSINSSYIALIPKKNNPKTVDDFRPISLLNYSVKCITKLLATRLQSVIIVLVHEN